MARVRRGVRIVMDRDDATLEVDGVVDVVAAYDIGRAVSRALGARVQRIHLDLSRVQRLDPACAGVMTRCVDAARGAGVELSVDAISAPLRARRALVGLGGIPMGSPRHRSPHEATAG